VKFDCPCIARKCASIVGGRPFSLKLVPAFRAWIHYAMLDDDAVKTITTLRHTGNNQPSDQRCIARANIRR
jgi:hypothetical protein